MASISTRTKKDGSKSFMVRWREPKTGKAQGLTVATESEAETLKRLLDANGQNFEIAQHAILTNAKRVPTVAEVIQEHIDLLIRPSSGTVKTYQTMLDFHVKKITSQRRHTRRSSSSTSVTWSVSLELRASDSVPACRGPTAWHSRSSVLAAQ
ncbi:hypothetical protein [Paenarthrobacter nitroguajacolicus]|uniref:hypothetical protein n=1 Tax=Paenarthrobacter nitroguajacolicus TaxID=211146 RepID=UPI00342D2DEF